MSEGEPKGDSKIRDKVFLLFVLKILNFFVTQVIFAFLYFWV